MSEAVAPPLDEQNNAPDSDEPNKPRSLYRTGWRRTGALFVDGSVLTLCLWPFEEALAGVTVGPVVAWFWFLYSGSVSFAYSIVCHKLWGQTLGKWALGVRVQDLAQPALTWKQSLLRDAPLIVGFVGQVGIVAYRGVPQPNDVPEQAGALKVLLLLQMIWVTLEIITMLFSRKRRAVHDFLAGTVVVKTRTNVGYRGFLVFVGSLIVSYMHISSVLDRARAEREACVQAGHWDEDAHRCRPPEKD